MSFRRIVRTGSGQRLAGKVVRQASTAPSAPLGPWDAHGFCHLVDAYRDYLVVHRGVTETTSEHHGQMLRLFGDCMAGRGRASVLDCTVADLDAFTATLTARQWARSTLHNYLASLRGFFRWLFDEGHSHQDLSPHIHYPRVYRQTHVARSLSWEQVQHLIATVGLSPMVLRDRAIVLLLATYGLRSGEVRGLRLDDVDWDHEILHVRKRKAGVPLQLPLEKGLREALQAWCSVRPHADHSLMFVHSTGHALARSGVRGIVQRWGHLAGLGNVHPHMLRHSVGRRLMEQGVRISRIAKLLGQSSLQATETYLRISLEQLREVADNYAELLGSDAP